jgi:hypothetical protein
VAEKPGRFVRLAEAFELDVGAIGFYSVDATGHRFWRAAFPGEFDAPRTAEEEGYAGLIGETLRGVDAAIGRLAASLAPEDAILVVSDHGFQAGSDARTIWSVRLHQQLGPLGLDPERDGFAIEGEFVGLSLRVLPGPAEKREPGLARLQALLESVRGTGGEPLLDVDVIEVAERPAEARAPFLLRVRAAVVRQLLYWVYGVELDRPAYAYLLGRPRDAALAAVFPDGEIAVGDRRMRARDLFSRDAFSGTHEETAIFLAAGGPFAHVAARDRVSVLDVAPLLFHLAGAPVPDDLEGRVPERLLDPAQLAARPVRVVPAAELPGLPAEPDGAAVDDAVLMQRLRALGYVE